jgi:hypothetical protein
MLIISIILEAAVTIIAVLAARSGNPYIYGLAFTAQQTARGGIPRNTGAGDGPQIIAECGLHENKLEDVPMRFDAQDEPLRDRLGPCNEGPCAKLRLPARL